MRLNLIEGKKYQNRWKNSAQHHVALNMSLKSLERDKTGKNLKKI